MISIKGKIYSGNQVIVMNDQVIIDGQAVEDDESGGRIVKIEVTGDLTSLQSDRSVLVEGNVQGNVNAKGSVTCGNVNMDVDAGGSVTCDNVRGDVNAGGNVTCAEIGGSVRAGGNVVHG